MTGSNVSATCLVKWHLWGGGVCRCDSAAQCRHQLCTPRWQSLWRGGSFVDMTYNVAITACCIFFYCNVHLQSHAVVDGQLFLSNRVSGCLFHQYFLAFCDTVEAWVYFLSCGICVVLLCEWDKSRGDQGFYGETKNPVLATGFLQRQPATRSVVAAFISRRTYAASPSCCTCS